MHKFKLLKKSATVGGNRKDPQVMRSTKAMTMPRQEVKGPFQEREKELTGGRDFDSVISGFQALSLASLVTEQLDTSTINDNYLSAYWPISEVAPFVIQIIDIFQPRKIYIKVSSLSGNCVSSLSLSVPCLCRSVNALLPPRDSMVQGSVLLSCQVFFSGNTYLSQMLHCNALWWALKQF